MSSQSLTHKRRRDHLAFDDSQTSVTYLPDKWSIGFHQRPTRAGFHHDIKHNASNPWYAPSQIVGTAFAPPPILNAIIDPNKMGTGSPVVHLAHSAAYRDSKVHGFKRARTGNPTTDGLVGIESNPGPSPSLPKKGKGPTTQRIGGNRRLGRKHTRDNVEFRRGISSMHSNPVSVGSSYDGSKMQAVISKGETRVLGTRAHIYHGRCAFQQLASNGSNTLQFNDTSGYASFCYLNPRICCQNANYANPAGACPIGVIAQPFRRFSFRKLRIHYQPLFSTTATSGVVALAYDPEVITTSSLGTIMSYANFEASSYGPVWMPQTLDLTKWIDRSRWFYGETPANIATSLIASQAIQGTLMVCPTVMPAPNVAYGMLFMEFELALSELGPTEVFSAPAVSSSSSSSTDPTVFRKEPGGETVHEEYLVVNGVKTLIQSSIVK